MPAPAETLTERLRCRTPTADDLPGYLELFLTPEVQRWLRPAPLPPFRPDQLGGMLDCDVAHWAAHGFGPWVLHDRETGAVVGRAGPVWTTATGTFAVELAWSIVPDRWGQGLATEAARAAVAVTRAEHVDEVVSFTLPENAASRRVMEQAGLRYERRFEHVGLEHVLYRLPAD